MSRKMSFPEMASGGWKFFRYLILGGLFNINLEVTKRCNARCDFCDYWQEQPPAELEDYVEVVKHLRPLSVSLTGGEPLLRKDLEQVIGSLRRHFGFLFLSLVTNGSLLTPARGLELWNAGLDEMSISLDYPDQRHDRERGIPGLAARILTVAPDLVRAGVNLCFNIVLKRENFREVPALVRLAGELGVKASVSSYNGWRIGNQEHTIGEEDLRALEEVVDELVAMRRNGSNLTTGEYYLEKIPEFFSQKGIPGCSAGVNWLQVTPDGNFKRCSDHPVAGHFSEWRRGFFSPASCDRCWYSCRGAAQEPWTVRRFAEMAREALGWEKS
jgi:MoaA/NifB/PqqE/SkfB family radical SAM enzyme